MGRQVREQIDRTMTIDLAERGIGHLYAAARARVGAPLAWAAAEKLAALPKGSVALLTTGMATRPHVSPRIAENDGPAGAAALARVLSEALEVIPVLLAEEGMLPALIGVFQAAGMVPVSLEEARRTTQPGGRLAVAVPWPYPLEDSSEETAVALVEQLKPSLAFATERVGRNDRGVYHGMRGVNYGRGLAHVDLVVEAAQARGIPTVCVGDGGNEIGMGLIADAVRERVAFGRHCICGCGGGIGAVTGCDVLVTSTVSNWGCAAVADCLAVLLDRRDLVHSAEHEAMLLRRSTELGLINSPAGRVDADVDGIPLRAHLAAVELLAEIARRA